MTSTNIFKGVSEEGRSSSRVLRPPGGGHTDVLGLGSQSEAPHCKKPSPRNISSIMEGTNQLPTSPVKQQPAKAAAPSVPENKPEDNTSQQRVRVPPGGFSSGLW